MTTIPVKLGVLGRCGFWISIIFNIIILALGLLAIGILYYLDTNLIADDDVKTLLNDINFNGVLPLGRVAGDLPLMLIGVAGVNVFLSILGICTVCFKSQRGIILFVYVTLLVVVVQGILTGMLAVMKNKVEYELDSSLLSQFPSYEGVNSNNAISKAWDKIFINFECCGYDTIGSLESNAYEFNVTSWWPNRDSSLDLVPTSCCRDAAINNYMSYLETDCERTLLTHHKQGCFQPMYAYFTKYQGYAIDLSISLLVFQVLCTVVPTALCCAVRRAKHKL